LLNIFVEPMIHYHSKVWDKNDKRNDINMFIQQEHIKLMKSDSNVTKDFYF